MVTSVPLTTRIVSNTMPLFHYQQAMAEGTTIPKFLTYHKSTYGINIQYLLIGYTQEVRIDPTQIAIIAVVKYRKRFFQGLMSVLKL